MAYCLLHYNLMYVSSLLLLIRRHASVLQWICFLWDPTLCLWQRTRHGVTKDDVNEESLKDWTHSQREGCVSLRTLLWLWHPFSCVWREFYLARSYFITAAARAPADSKRITRVALFSLTLSQGWEVTSFKPTIDPLTCQVNSFLLPRFF